MEGIRLDVVVSIPEKVSLAPNEDFCRRIERGQPDRRDPRVVSGVEYVKHKP